MWEAAPDDFPQLFLLQWFLRLKVVTGAMRQSLTIDLNLTEKGGEGGNRVR